MMLNVTGLMKLYNVGVGFLEKEREKKRGCRVILPIQTINQGYPGERSWF